MQLGDLTGDNLRNQDRWFNYTVTIAAAQFAAAMAAAVPLAFNLAAGYDFLWSETTYYADIAGAAQTDSTRVIPEAMVQFFLAQEPYQGEELPLQSVAGDGRHPYQLPVPFWIRGQAALVLNVRNASAATAYNLWVTISGFRRPTRLA